MSKKKKKKKTSNDLQELSTQVGSTMIEIEEKGLRSWHILMILVFVMGVFAPIVFNNPSIVMLVEVSVGIVGLMIIIGYIIERRRMKKRFG